MSIQTSGVDPSLQSYPRHPGPRDFVIDSLGTGAIASLTTTVAAAAFGAVEIKRPLGPLNAVSHILWGDESARHDRASFQYTATGLVLNAAAVTSWAVVHETLFGRAGEEGDTLGALLGGACVSLLAYVTDYYIVPKRLTPGFEKRLSNRSLFGIYAALAFGLGIGSTWRVFRRRRFAPHRSGS